MRLLAVLAIVGVLVTGCGTAAPTPPPPKPAPTVSLPSSAPTGAARLATWDRTGEAYASPILAPYVVVYADGLVVIDGARTLRLSTLEITQLRSGLEWNLAGMPSKIEAGGGIANQLSAYAASGALLKVIVNGKVDHLKVPKRVQDAFARLNLLIGQTAAGYSADRVCAVWTSPSSQDVAAPWPAGVPVPTTSPELQRLSGAPAQAVASVPGAVTRFQTAAGEHWLLQWRYLLPDEPRAPAGTNTCAG